MTFGLAIGVKWSALYLLAAFGPKDYAKNYVGEAFGNLLNDVVAFAQANGLSGKDVLLA